MTLTDYFQCQNAFVGKVTIEYREQLNILPEAAQKTHLAAKLRKKAKGSAAANQKAKPLGNLDRSPPKLDRALRPGVGMGAAPAASRDEVRRLLPTRIAT